MINVAMSDLETLSGIENEHDTERHLSVVPLSTTEELQARLHDIADPDDALFEPRLILSPAFRDRLHIRKPERQVAYNKAARELFTASELVKVELVDKFTIKVNGEPLLAQDPDQLFVLNAFINNRGYRFVDSIRRVRYGVRPLDIHQSPSFAIGQDSKSIRSSRLGTITNKFDNILDEMGAKRGTVHAVKANVVITGDRSRSKHRVQKASQVDASPAALATQILDQARRSAERRELYGSHRLNARGNVPLNDLESQFVEKLVAKQADADEILNLLTVERAIITAVCEGFSDVDLPQFTENDRKAFRMAMDRARAADGKQDGWEDRFRILRALELKIWG